MKVCLACDRRYADDGWRCASCGYEPVAIHGFPAFAPELDRNSDGFVESYFEELALLEAGSFWFRSRNRLIAWALATHFPDARDLLEIGCGTGFVLAGLRAAAPRLRLAASDVFTRGLRFAQDRVPEATVFQMDARAMPFDAEFDVIGAFDVLEHIEEDERVLAQMFQGCRPGGGILVTVPQHMALWSQNDETARHRRRYSRSELVRKTRAVGFDVTHVTSFVSLPLPLMFASRLRKQQASHDYDPLAELRLPRPVDALLDILLTVERTVIRTGASLPAGGSLLLVAHRGSGPNHLPLR
jgi:SAM-dependent methyltransferase